MKAPTESALVRSCLDLLALRNVLAWRSNNVPVPLPGGKGFRRFVGVRGLPDILAVLPHALCIEGTHFQLGVLAGVECKTATGRQSAEQRAFQARLEAAGGAYWLIRDIKDLDERLNAAL